MKRLSSALLILCLLLSLAACGGASSAPAAGGAGPEAGPESPASSAPASSAPACEHDWQPATFAAPETCAKCGETRGGAKQTFFAENGLEVAGQLPGDTAPVTFVTYLKDDRSQFYCFEDGTAAFYSIVEPAEEEGYKKVTLQVDVILPIRDPDHILNGTYRYTWTSGIYDLYTGLEIPQADQSNGGGFSSEILIDGQPCPVGHFRQDDWSSGDYYTRDDGLDGLDAYCCATIELVVPEAYDGLVFALIPKFEPTILTGNEEEDPAPVVVTEDLSPERLAGTLFFRFGQDAA